MATHFKRNVELDALLIFTLKERGPRGYIGLARRMGCPSDGEALARGRWLKKQPRSYTNQVGQYIDDLIDGTKQGPKPGLLPGWE